MRNVASGFLTYEEEGRAILRSLTDEQAGAFFKAKISYMFDGILPEFRDPALVMLWQIVKHRLDSDQYAYYLKSLKNAYKAYLRDYSGPPEEKLSIRSWFIWKRSLLEAEARNDSEYRIPRAYEAVEPEDL